MAEERLGLKRSPNVTGGLNEASSRVFGSASHGGKQRLASAEMKDKCYRTIPSRMSRAFPSTHRRKMLEDEVEKIGCWTVKCHFPKEAITSDQGLVRIQGSRKAHLSSPLTRAALTTHMLMSSDWIVVEGVVCVN